MTTGQQDRAKQRNGQKARSRQPQTLAAHPAFSPILGVWGAALAGLSIMVLPAPMMVQASKGNGLVLLGSQAQILLAAFAALLLGGVLFVVASRMHRKARRRIDGPSIVSLAARRVNTIDPARELGSLRLDDPVETVPFAAAAAHTPDRPEPSAPAAAMPPPRALDLSEFAELPGRNGVWVEDIAAQAETAPQPPAATALRLTPKAEAEPAQPADPKASALARLRELPTQELSLVQMVERFAGALHEHREGTSGNAGAVRDIAAREAALAEALRALAALSGERTAAPEGEPLRDAITRLQGLRGAA